MNGRKPSESRPKAIMVDVFIMISTLPVLARPIAAVIGGFALLNLLGGLLRPGFDANLWWIDLRAWPALVAHPFMLGLSVLLIGFASQPFMQPRRQMATVICVSIALLMAMSNAATCHQLAAQGWIDVSSPFSISLLVAMALLVVLWAVVRTRRDITPKPASTPAMLMASSAVLALVLIGFPLAQMFCFGTTSYARSVDAIIVPGARAYADGRPSVPLADRVRTACDLYHQGLSKVLIFSGGPGDGDIHETEAMRLYAISLGVPDHAILLDPQGLSTQATVNHTLPMLDRIDATRIMVVSHFYHLPRLKLTYQREGREVFTVPAKESYTLRAMPIYLMREVAALWWYYMRPVMG